ncbi:Transcription initiation factor [Globisporangium polare]
MISERAHAECVRLLELLINKRVQESWSWVFMTPVTDIPGYDQIIKKPMDLGTVKKHLGSKPSRCRFKSHEKFARDVRLVFHNAMVYNKDDQHVRGSVFDAAQHLLRVFETAYAKAIGTVFKEEARDDDQDQEQPPGAATVGGSASAAVSHSDATKNDSQAVSGEHKSGDASASEPKSSSSSSSRHRHGESGLNAAVDGDGDVEMAEEGKSSKHKKDKPSKKEKKSKKSKKKSKDKEKKHSSSSSGESKKKSHKSSSRDKDKDRERSKDKHSSSTSGDGERASSKSAAIEGEVSAAVPKSSSSSSSSGLVSSSSVKTEAPPAKASSSSSSSSSSVKPEPVSSSAHVSSSSKSSSSSAKKSDSGSSHSASVTAAVTAPSSATAMPSASSSSGKMSDSEIQACLGVLMKLIKYKEGSISPAAPFLQPVELSHFPDYRVKVPNRMHLYGVQKKLRNGGYADIHAFAHDVRLIFSNCLIYNSDVILSKVMRSHAVTLMKLFETLLEKIGGSWGGIAERWKCHQILHEILAHRTDGQETAQWFKYPIQTYFDSADQIPYGYYKKIKVPMDIGTVSARLHLSEYKHVSEFIKEVKLIFDNCIRYWKPDPQGQTYCESARVLTNLLKSQVDNVFGSALSEELHSKDKHKSSSSSGSSSSKSHRPSSASSSSAAPVSLAVSATSSAAVSALPPPTPSVDEKSAKRKSSSKSSFALKDVCVGIMKQLRAHKMKGYRGVDILTSGPFLHAVDTTKYPDYLKIISEPMDFAKIERKLKGDRYGSADEFSADVHLIFSNCHKYNSDPIEGADIRAMATSLRDYFVELYNEKLSRQDGGTTGSATKSVAEAKPIEVVSARAAPVKLAVASDAKPRVAVKPEVSTTSSSDQLKAKAPSRSPTKKSSSEPAASSSSASREPERQAPLQVPSSASSSRVVKQEGSFAPSVVKVKDNSMASATPSSVVPPMVASKPKVELSSALSKDAAPPKPATMTSSSSMSASLSPAEAEELKRKKERKEKKEKKEKKKEKKEKKKKKDREKKKKDRKDKSVERPADGSSSSVKRASSSSTAPAVTSSAVAFAAPVTVALSKQKPAPAVTTVVVKAAPLPVTPIKSSSVGSKVSAAELQKASSSTSGSSSKIKGKKSKKSDLNSWESSSERVLNRLQKIEQVAKLHFGQPLLEIFPQLQAEYSRLISEPMDLRTLREQLHAHTLTMKEFIRKGRVIFQNAIKFNCASDPASLHVREMSSHLQWYFDSLCAELNLLESDADKVKQKQLRQERGELVAKVPMDIKPKECLKLLRVLNSQKYDKNCWPFRKPVKVLFPTLAVEYFDIIKNPMDLATISDKVGAFEYKHHGDFIRDVRLTFENAIIYNKADKDREGWSVYAAAIHMLSVAEDLWSDVTLEVTERLRRKDMLRKERERLGEKKKPSEKRLEKERLRTEGESKKPSSSSSSSLVSAASEHTKQSLRADKELAHSQQPPLSGATVPSHASASSDSVLAATTIVTSVSSGSASRDGSPDLSATRLKLSIVNRQNVDRMNKSERKAEEKRRKRARREEEIARSEKRRRTAVAATDDALREAEARSRRKQQKLEIAQAMKLREERDLKAREAEAERALGMKMKFNAATWTGELVPAQKTSQGFWTKKRIKLQLPAAFQSQQEHQHQMAMPIDSY